MEKITVRSCTLDELIGAFNFQQLIDAYAAESAMPEIGTPIADLSMYQAIESAGLMSVVCAFQGDQIVGFIVLLVNRLPHYGKTVATTESFFVEGAYRKGGTGKLMLGVAEMIAKGKGAEALLVSAPVDSALDMVMPFWGYRASNNVYAKAL